jgi:hypothetical protein
MTLMTDQHANDLLDRHALVMCVWTPSTFVAAAFLHLGLSGGGLWWVATAFTVIIATFIGHIIINVVTGMRFTAGETALGGVAFAAALCALILGRVFGPDTFGADRFMATGLGMFALVIAVIIYLLISFGPRSAFAKFDVIRDNNLRTASRLPHRGGRK